jgi:hypothetical protein
LHGFYHFAKFTSSADNGAYEMNVEQMLSENGTVHKIAMDIDRVINALEYAESDPDVAYKPAALIKICINQLRDNLSVLNHELGYDWPENK